MTARPRPGNHSRLPSRSLLCARSGRSLPSRELTFGMEAEGQSFGEDAGSVSSVDALFLRRDPAVLGQVAAQGVDGLGALTRPPRRPRRRPSSSTACAKSAGASWSATTPTAWTSSSAPIPKPPTARSSSTPSPRKSAGSGGPSREHTGGSACVIQRSVAPRVSGRPSILGGGSRGQLVGGLPTSALTHR
jgi:hypothetical protein